MELSEPCDCGDNDFGQMQTARKIIYTCENCGLVFEVKIPLLLTDPDVKETRLNIKRDIDISFGDSVPEECKEEATQLLCVHAATVPKGYELFELFLAKLGKSIKVSPTSRTGGQRSYFLFISPQLGSKNSVPVVPRQPIL